MSNINTFIAAHKGFARPSRFRVQITYPAIVGTPNTRDEVFIHTASLPASITGVATAYYFGRAVPIRGDRQTQPFQCTIYNDIDFSHRNTLERWMNLSVGHESNIQATPNYKDLDGIIDIFQLGLDDTVLKHVKLLGVFPNDVAQIDLGYQIVDTIEEYTVNFEYTHWVSENTPTT